MATHLQDTVGSIFRPGRRRRPPASFPCTPKARAQRASSGSLASSSRPTMRWPRKAKSASRQRAAGWKRASIVGRDPTTDIALLRIADTALPPVTLSTAIPAAGALALAVGADDGGATAALGIVSLSGPAWRSLRGGEIDARIELDARLRRRSEGAVAIDAAGQVFGMAVFGAAAARAGHPGRHDRPRRRAAGNARSHPPRIPGPGPAPGGGRGRRGRSHGGKRRRQGPRRQPPVSIRATCSSAGTASSSAACGHCCAASGPIASAGRSPSSCGAEARRTRLS